MADEEQSPYEILGLTPEATLQDITSTYRKKSRKVHPDRNPDNPNAAHEFHLLKEAFDKLSDPTKRQAIDYAYKSKQARNERFANLDKKRKDLMEDLEAREKAAKKSRTEAAQKEREKLGEVARLREEAANLRKARSAKKAQANKPTPQPSKTTVDVGEDDVLARMRQAERERMAEELRKQEEEEEGNEEK